MTGAVQNEEMTEELLATGTDGPGNLREAVAERVAAHRNRRAASRAQDAELEAAVHQRRERTRKEAREGVSVVRDAVLARYQNTPSYREFLAEEAERALAQAQAEAEVATRTARAVVDTQMQLLEEIDQWNRAEPGPREEALAKHEAGLRSDLAHALADIALGARELMAEGSRLTVRQSPAPRMGTGLAESPKPSPVAEVSAAGLTVKLFEDLGSTLSSQSPSLSRAPQGGIAEYPGELQQLEEEIAFRRAPEFEDLTLEPQSIPGNLIEFPRQLVAARKVRPRLAEGPLRDEEIGVTPQLRIFEVEAEQEAMGPVAPEVHADAPEWQSLSLEAAEAPRRPAPESAQAHFTTEPMTAPLELRAMAAAVDGCLIGAACLVCASGAAWVAGPELGALSPALLLASAVGVLAVFGLLYQVLFFTFSDSTPGMLYARIGLCTFGDRNPTRQAMRRRIFATVLAACPLGLGLLWMWMDDDRLGWHDRMSRMYQRAY